MADWIAAVSSVAPSPIAPKFITSHTVRLFGGAIFDGPPSCRCLPTSRAGPGEGQGDCQPFFPIQLPLVLGEPSVLLQTEPSVGSQWSRGPLRFSHRTWAVAQRGSYVIRPPKSTPRSPSRGSCTPYRPGIDPRKTASPSTTTGARTWSSQ